jgi:DNA repair protein RadD
MSALVGFNQPLSAEQLVGYGHNSGATQPLEDRWYQTEAVDALFDYFAKKGGTNADGTPVRANPLICLPTGTGKSVVIARFIWRAMTMHPGTRVFMSTHVKELIAQNAKKMLEIWPNAPLGVYSAGLKQRDSAQPIIFGGVQSCVGKFPLFGRRDLLVVDEAHLIAEEGRYLQFINELTNGPEGADKISQNYNPYLKVIGLSATAYRLGLGGMTNGSIFTDVAYDLCTIDGFTRLIAEGFLCPLIPKRTNTELSTSGIGISANGEFIQSQAQAAVDKPDITYKALCELVEAGINRRSWLIFASGVEHADHIGEMLNTVFGIPTVVIHSKKTAKENEDNLELWKTGQVRCAVNMNSLTTGVDHPCCDLIGVLRLTNSPGLWVQMLGRGTRPYDSEKERNPIVAAAFPGVKLNCLVLDFAGNTRRLGPINDPVIPKKKGEGPAGDAPVWICSNCNFYNHSSARVCGLCGAEHIFHDKISGTASELELLRSDLPQMEYYSVQRVVMVPHTSKAGNSTIKIAYYCGLQTFYEYQNFEATIPFLKHRARDWFRQRYHYTSIRPEWGGDVPVTNNQVLELSNELRPPNRLKVWVNKQTPEVMGYEF